MKYLPILKNSLNNIRKPNYLVTDNGAELKNKLLTEYYKDNEIKFINGIISRQHL